MAKDTVDRFIRLRVIRFGFWSIKAFLNVLIWTKLVRRHKEMPVRLERFLNSWLKLVVKLSIRK